MSMESIERQFHEKVSTQIRLSSEGLERYRILTPFLFEDGDHLVIVLKQEAGEWVLTDEAHTYMHLTYDIDEKDLQRGTRQKIIANALSTFRVEDREGELILKVPNERFGDSLYSFIQALLKISDVTYLTRERARSTFMEDFRALMSKATSEDSLSFDWHDPARDPRAMYTVDCRVNSMPRPLFVYALPNDGRARDATISLLQFEKWGIPHRSLAIFEDQESINRKVLARLSDVCEKQFSTLSGNYERIARFLGQAITESDGAEDRARASGPST